MIWRNEMETTLDGGVISLSVLADGSELLAGTQEGSIYRVLLGDLTASKVHAAWKRLDTNYCDLSTIRCRSRELHQFLFPVHQLSVASCFEYHVLGNLLTDLCPQGVPRNT